MGDDHHLSDTLSLRFRQSGSRIELSKLSDDDDDEIADVDLTIVTSDAAAAADHDSDFDDDFKVGVANVPRLLHTVPFIVSLCSSVNIVIGLMLCYRKLSFFGLSKWIGR